jgi:hypothetical protein
MGMNVLYPSAKQMLLEAQLNWLTDPIYAILLDTGFYTYSPNHTSLADIDGQAFIRSSTVLTGRSSLLGAADANDLDFDPVLGGPIIRAMILVKDGGTAAGSKLVAYIDQAVNLPYTPDGRNIVVIWDNGPNRIFHI